MLQILATHCTTEIISTNMFRKYTNGELSVVLTSNATLQIYQVQELWLRLFELRALLLYLFGIFYLFWARH